MSVSASSALQRRRYFLDTNALLARFLARIPGSALVRTVCDPGAQHTLLIAEITEAELCATLHQLRRGGGLRAKSTDRLIDLFWQQVHSDEYAILAITSEVVHRAAALCSTHSLRGYDAVQLSCALFARDTARAVDASSATSGSPILGDPIFMTADKRLQQAAVAEGFTLLDPTDSSTYNQSP